MKQFLIVRLGAMGDVIHGIPVAAALRAAYPDARIDWLVDPRYLELLGLVQGLDHPIPVDPRAIARGPGRRAFQQTLRRLRETRYDAVIDLQGLLKSAMLARSVRGRRTIGFPRKHLREQLARVFYTDAPDPGEARHVARKNLGLLRILGITDGALRFPLTIPAMPEEEALRQRFEPSGYVLINPGAAWPNKRWPPDRFGEVAAALARDLSLRSLVLWGPGEEDIAGAVVTASAGAAELSPPTTIGNLFGLSRGARLMISGDTGPLHIAAAVGTPVVALFGPTRADRNGPWSSDDEVISRVDRCSCVYERRCRLPNRCIDEISVAEVTSAVHRRLAAHG